MLVHALGGKCLNQNCKKKRDRSTIEMINHTKNIAAMETWTKHLKSIGTYIYDDNWPIHAVTHPLICFQKSKNQLRDSPSYRFHHSHPVPGEGWSLPDDIGSTWLSQKPPPAPVPSRAHPRRERAVTAANRSSAGLRLPPHHQLLPLPASLPLSLLLGHASHLPLSWLPTVVKHSCQMGLICCHLQMEWNLIEMELMAAFEEI